MVTSRILNRRRLAPGQTQNRRHVTRQRRSARPALLRAAAYADAIRLRLGVFARVYVLGAAAVVVTIAYLAVSAQATGSSYQLNQLQAQQSQLTSEGGQLSYQEAMLHTPARVQIAAQKQGLARPTTFDSVPFQPVTFDVYQPIGQTRPDQRPLWQQLLGAALARLFDAVSPRSPVPG
ncbi:MAG: hypothetical protein WAM30_12055 [Candidatus Dormiibacterota bacterium]